MKEHLVQVIIKLEKEKQELIERSDNLVFEIAQSNKGRKDLADRIVKLLIPNLGKETYRTLSNIPGFEFPIKSSWCGFKKEIDPCTSISLLRVSLLNYLNTMDLKDTPETWREAMEYSDQNILLLQNEQHFIADQLEAIDEKIAGVERLVDIDEDKLSPETKEKIGKALFAVAEKKGGIKPISTPMKNVAYPSDQEKTSTGPDLLEMYLWYQLLNPHSDFSSEAQNASFVENKDAFAPGGGDFGGAGASGSWDEKTDSQQFQGDQNNLEYHESRGSGAFS